MNQQFEDRSSNDGARYHGSGFSVESGICDGVDDDSNLIDEEEFAKLFKDTMDSLVHDRFEAFDESIQEFSDSINKLHTAILETREQQKVVLEEQRTKQLEAFPEESTGGGTATPSSMPAAESGWNSHGDRKIRADGHHGMKPSYSTPSLSSPYRHVAGIKSHSPTSTERGSAPPGNGVSGTRYSKQGQGREPHLKPMKKYAHHAYKK